MLQNSLRTPIDSMLLYSILVLDTPQLRFRHHGSRDDCFYRGHFQRSAYHCSKQERTHPDVSAHQQHTNLQRHVYDDKHCEHRSFQHYDIYLYKVNGLCIRGRYIVYDHEPCEHCNFKHCGDRIHLPCERRNHKQCGVYLNDKREDCAPAKNVEKVLLLRVKT